MDGVDFFRNQYFYVMGTPVKRKPKPTVLSDFPHDPLAYAIVTDESFDRKGRAIIAHVRAPHKGKLAIFAQVVILADFPDKVQLRCVLLSQRKATLLRDFCKANRIGVH